jgi:hypothetical protein
VIFNNPLTTDQQLTLISLAWDRQDGYVFFPWIVGSASDREARIRGWHESRAFHWPEERDEVIKHMEAHQDDDLYWCPNLFESKSRTEEWAMDEHALWADLDEVNPYEIDEEYRPSIAWETSPGRYQALWLVMRGHDIQGASWRGRENQRLTYYLGADRNGWDATQLLRIPGWKNHKPIHRGGSVYGPNKKLRKPPRGKLLWAERGRAYLPDHWNDLPQIEVTDPILKNILEEEVDQVDRHKVWGRVRLLVSGRVREFVSAREATGDRSTTLWEIERELADAGCTVVEIVAIVRELPWNKYEGRGDELRRLTTEAAKAVAERKEKPKKGLEDEDEELSQHRFTSLIRNIKKPVWIVEDILTKASCGFIAGQPKTFKSWCALDLAFSVATGAPFLDRFEVKRPGPVLYIQEEDALPLLKLRTDKMWPNKQAYDIVDMNKMPLDALVGEGVVLSDPGWQSWLDNTLARGDILSQQPYTVLILDPLLMLAGDVEENRAADMTTKIFLPLKQLAKKHDCAIILVHHMKKAEGQGIRGGQMMLGSVANHAWSEDSLYFRLQRGRIQVERESKHTASGSFVISNIKNLDWAPVVLAEASEMDEHEDNLGNGQVRTARAPRSIADGHKPKALIALQELRVGTTSEVAARAGLTANGAFRQLQRLAHAGKVTRDDKTWRLNGQ